MVVGVFVIVNVGVKFYLMILFVNLMYNVLGFELVDFYKGIESVEDVLVDVEVVYVIVVKEVGFLN